MTRGSALHQSLMYLHDNPSSSMTVASLGSLDILVVNSERHSGIDQIGTLTQTRSDRVLLILVESGCFFVTQKGRQIRFEAGQYVLFDCQASLAFKATGDFRAIIVLLPLVLLKARLRNAQGNLGQPRVYSGAAWRIAADFVRMLYQEVRFISAPLAYGYSTQVLELLSVAMESEATAFSDHNCRSLVFRRCSAFIRSHYADPGLDPQKIADAMGISARYLHKIFQEAGESVCEYLRETRLEATRIELADPRKFHTQIGEIAHRAGFRSQAHFAAAFKTRYGISATQWRRSAHEVRPDRPAVHHDGAAASDHQLNAASKAVTLRDPGRLSIRAEGQLLTAMAS